MDLIGRVASFFDSPGHELFRGRGCSLADIARAQDALGVLFHEDYKAFVMTFGGSFVGAPIYGFNNSSLLESSTVVDLTERFRSDRWPGADDAYVISFDMAGNPVMVDPSGAVITYDHDSGEMICLSTSFRGFVEDML